MPSLKAQLLWCRRLQFALAAVSLLGITAFALAVYLPREARLRDLRRELAAAELQPIMKQTDVAAGGQSPRATSASSAADAEALVRELSRAADDAKLTNVQWRPGAPSGAGGQRRQPIELSCEGDFLGVFTLLRKAEELPPAARFRSVEIKSQDPQSGRVQVEASLDVNSPEER